jgi:DNA-binding transcriptional ArsR family regulator
LYHVGIFGRRHWREFAHMATKAASQPRNDDREAHPTAMTETIAPQRAERIHHPAVEALNLATIMRTLGDPLRLEIVRLIGEEDELLCGEIYKRLGLPASTGSYHTKMLREAGITRSRAAGTQRLISLRRDDLEARFPGLLDAVLSAVEREATAVPA